MGAITDLWKSERGLVAIVSLALVSAAMFTGHIAAEQWESLLKWIITGYTAAKTVTGSVEIMTRNSAAEPQPMPSSTASGEVTS